MYTLGIKHNAGTRKCARISTARNGVHIINLQKTIRMYHDAAFREQARFPRKTILFVATKRQAQTVIEEAAKRCKMPM